MLDISQLRNDFKGSKERLKDRVPSEKLDAWHTADVFFRKKKTELDDVLATKKSVEVKARTDVEARKKVVELKSIIQSLQETVIESEKISKQALQSLPNFPDASTPRGKSEKDNALLKTVGKPKTLAFQPRTYLELTNADRYFRLEQARNVSGARFAYMTGEIAKLEFALLQYTMQTLVQEGFELVFPPTLIRAETMKAMGYLDQAGDQEIFHMRDDELVLVGTAEQSLGPLHMNDVLPESQLPKRYVAFTPCYRREAGSYGKDTKGILRLHQFEKIEMFSFVQPERSQQEHDYFLSLQEKLVQGLGLHYRVLDLCAGDLGHPSSRTFDIECFMPGQNNGKGEYRETHSTSNCTDYQSRRLNAKFSDGKEKKFVHTVNGTAFALQRIIIAIMEQYQQKDGSFTVPDSLKPFMLKS